MRKGIILLVLSLMAMGFLFQCQCEKPTEGQDNDQKIDSTIPAPIISHTLTGKSFTVTWEAVSHELGITGYVVNYNGQDLDLQTGTNFSKSDLPGGTYEIKVRTVGKNGLSSEYSNLESINVSFEWRLVGTEGFSAIGVTDTEIIIDNGTPYVAYIASGSGVVSKFNGSAWEVLGGAPFSTNTGDRVGFDLYSGTPYVGYKDTSAGGQATARKYTGSWSTIGTVGFSTSTMMNQGMGSLVVEGPSSVYFAFSQSGDGFGQIYHFNGTSWSDVTGATVSSYLLRQAVHNSILYLAYSNAGTLYLRTYDGAWTDVDNFPGDGPEMSMANGTPYIAYMDISSANELAVKKFAAGWQNVGSRLTINAVNHNQFKIITSNGNLYIAYSDPDNGDKLSVQKFNGSAWELLGTVAFSSTIATHISIGADGDIPYVSFVNSDGKVTVMKYY